MKTTLLIAVPLTLLAACAKPDPAALAQGDEAFKGQMVDGVLQPVAVRVVKVGMNGAQAPACAARTTPKSDELTVRWSTDAAAPAKAEISGEVAVCEDAGEWRGIVFPATGQSLSSCDLDRNLRSPQEYQGPCRSGWVKVGDLKG